MIFLRSLVFNILCYSLILMGCIVTVLLGWFIPKKFIWLFWNDAVLILLRNLLKWICGLKIEIRGAHNIQNSPAIYACKHQSALETYILTSYIKNATFIFKKELTHIPFFGWAIALYGSVPVDRSGGSRALKNMLISAKKLLNRGQSIIIFPEGTRTQPGKTIEYKSGVACLYQNLDVPVIPVATNTGLFWKKNSFLRYPGKIIFEFLPPIPQDLDKKSFMSKLKNDIETKCYEINNESLLSYPYVKQFF